MLKRLFSFTLLLGLTGGIIFWMVMKEKPALTLEEEQTMIMHQLPTSSALLSPLPEEYERVVPESFPAHPKKDFFYPVPFTSQAPTGDWSRSEFQDGCEEASVIMVNAWRTGETLTREAVKQALLALAQYQEKKIGHGVDTDVMDTAELLLGEYFSITDYAVRYDFSLAELKQALTDGVVIVPTNGRLLGNPNFTPPGPLQHMVVIIGYDSVTEEFITNDPGTRKGGGLPICRGYSLRGHS